MSSRTRFGTSLAAAKGDAGADYRFAVREAAEILVRLISPMMPHLAEECWAALGHKDGPGFAGCRGLKLSPICW